MIWRQALLWLAGRRADLTGWLAALGFSAGAAAIRVGFGPVLDGAPFLVFFPAVIAASLVGGWGPGLLTTLLSVGAVLAVEPPQFLATGSGVTAIVVFALIAMFDIFLIDSLRRALRVNAAQQAQMRVLIDQQATMFREMQHRVGNNMQFIASLLSHGKRQLSAGATPGEVLDQAILRISSFARLHLKLHDITTYELGLDAVLSDIPAEIFTGMAVELRIHTQPHRISMAQMTALVMVVVEAATNAIKHVFSHGHGTLFEVQLRLVDDDRWMLLLRDDGPDGPGADPAPTRQTLGLRLMHGFAEQLQGQLTFERAGGMNVRLGFPRSVTTTCDGPSVESAVAPAGATVAALRTAAV